MTTSLSASPRTRLLLLIGALVFATTPTPAASQTRTPVDSVALWTETLETGTLTERMEAASRLYRIGPDSLPQGAVDAMVAELERLQDAMLYDLSIPGSDELVGEGFGEYYMDLSVFARAAGGEAARRSIILAAPVSLGMMRRAATFGDDAIPVLVEMLEQDFESSTALRVMALAWFWADSTGAALSPESRRTIVDQFTIAGLREDHDRVQGLAYALVDTGDPAFIPLARFIHEAVESDEPGLYGSLVLERRSIPDLQAEADRQTPVELLDRHHRMLGYICVDANAGSRLALCESTDNVLAATRRLLESGQLASARNTLEAAAESLDRALENGTITDAEHALIAGGIEDLVDRM